jgi:two-component sensor histidine kinase
LTSLLYHPSNSDRIDEVLANFREGGSIDLSSEDDFLSVRFSLLEYGNIPQLFRYRLDNDRNSISDDWFPLGRPEINLSGLSPGTNTLEIQARVRGSSWQNPSLRIPISVPFPWYQDPLKITFLTLLGASLVFSVIRIRLRNLRFRNKMLTDMVEDRTQGLKEALDLKEVYLKEVHHRVKNNLQIISSLLDLQAAGEPLPETRKAIGYGRSRIESISLIHKHLYLDPTSRNIHISDFIEEYVVMAEDAFIDDRDPVQWQIEGDDILLGIDEAQPFGLLLNELLTNSLQHGASDSGQHSIHIAWRAVDEASFRLEFSDSGPGLPQHIDLQNPQKLGLKMIHRLTKQLKGQFEHNQGDGLKWKFTFRCKFQNMK